MRFAYADEEGRYYEYHESFWTGKRSLSVNGRACAKLGKRDFVVEEEGGACQVKGSFLTGISLMFGNGRTKTLVKNKWYEWILILLPIANLGLGVLCGAIGGFLSALFAMLAAFVNAVVLRSKLNIVFKAIICLAVAVASFFAWFFIYYTIIVSLGAAIPGFFGN